MTRTKAIPDAAVFATIRQMLVAQGDRAVTFASVGRATKLAASTLVQRFGTRDAMVRAAVLAAWDDLDASTVTAIAADKGPQGLLKALDTAPLDLSVLEFSLHDPALRDRARLWRERVEAALALRLGGGDKTREGKAREGAAILFAAWQGQRVWQATGTDGFRLKDAVKRLD